MAARITITNPDGRTRWFTLEKGDSLTVGRGTENDIIVVDHRASHQHCTITAADDGYRVTDHDSEHGTLKNGERIDTAELKDGDVLTIGDTTVELTLPWMGTGTAASGSRRRNAWRTAGMFAASLCIIVLAAAGAFYIARNLRLGGSDGSPTVQSVSITTTPPGAMVFIDGRFVDVTPLSEVLLPPGPHAVRITKAGFAVHTRSIEVAGRPVVLQDIALEPAASGSAMIETDPPEVEVFLDGEPKGTTPLLLTDIPPGEHDLRLQKTGYVIHYDKLQIEPDTETAYRSRLKISQAESYLGLLKEEPNNCSYYAQLAHVYLLHGWVDEAIENFETAVELVASGADTSNYNPRLRELLTKIYGDLVIQWGTAEQVAKVRKEIDRIILELLAKYPDKRFLWDWQVAFIGGVGIPMNKEVVRDYIRQNPDGGAVFGIFTAEEYAKKGDLAQAIEILETALEELPDDYRLYYTLGKLHWDRVKKG